MFQSIQKEDTQQSLFTLTAANPLLQRPHQISQINGKSIVPMKPIMNRTVQKSHVNGVKFGFKNDRATARQGLSMNMKMAANGGPIFKNHIKSTGKYNELYNPAPARHTININQMIVEATFPFPLPKTNLGQNGLYNQVGQYFAASKTAIASKLEENFKKISVSKTPKDLGKVGVLFLQLGGPATIDDVKPFLYNMFSDPDIIRLPEAIRKNEFVNTIHQKPLAWIISTARASKSIANYEKIGGGSPMIKTTDDQSKAIQEELRARGINASTYVAMRYSEPNTAQALEQIKKDNLDNLVIVPLYPQNSVSTTGSSLNELKKQMDQIPELKGLKSVTIDTWVDKKEYIKAQAHMVMETCNKYKDKSQAHVMFSAHGVPKSYIEEGDPYQEQMEVCVKSIMDELKEHNFNNSHSLAYQSKVGPVEWLKPYTAEQIPEMGHQGVKDLVVVPISFVSEHIETLEEIDMEFKELAEEAGITGWERVPAFDCHPKFINAISDIIIKELPKLK